MNIDQASEYFGVSLDKLHKYEEQGLFDCHRKADGHVEYTEDLLEYIGLINVLTEAGSEVEDLRNFMTKLMQSSITNEEKIRFLRMHRQKLLEMIHTKQKSLDQLDYMIFDEKKKG